MQRRVGARLLAVLLTLVMALGLLPVGVLADGGEIAVCVSYQNGSYVIPKQQMTVSSGLAESYSYVDGVIDGVSAVDVLVKAHEVYFDAYVSEGTFADWLPGALVVNSAGSITRMFDEPANPSTLVNGDIPADGDDFYIVPEIEVKNNDYVEFLVYKDPFGGDCYTWFEDSQGEISTATVEAGAELPLYLKGDMLLSAMFGLLLDKDGMYNLIYGEDLTIVTLDPATGAVDEVLGAAVDDEDGSFTVTFSEPGNYILSALGDTGEDAYIFAPWLEVEVTASSPAKSLSFDVAPAGAVVAVYGADGVRQFPDEAGQFNTLTEGEVYTYTVALKDYKTQSVKFTFSDTEVISVTLTDAASSFTEIDAYWPSFRGNANNMAITNAETARNSDEIELLWAERFGGTGMFGPYPNTPVIVGDALIFSSGTTLHKLNKDTGETIATGTMVSSAAFNISSVTYGGGMVFVPVSNGRIQAFNADTLESLWVSEPMGGQSNSYITYHDGYVYTGFWSSAVGYNYYVCLSVTDEDPDQTIETKNVQWKHRIKAGYYWVNGIVMGDYIVFGGENGYGENIGSTNDPTKIYSLDRITGEVMDELGGFFGDQRSGISYDAVTDRLYFTTKAGYVNSAKLDIDTGKFISGSAMSKQVETGWQATGTPVVYDGVLFISSGAGVGGGGVMVAADAETLEILDSVSLLGYSQSSPLLSTAYADTGKLYIYCTYNGIIGGLTVVEYDIATKQLTKSELFTPVAEQQNYCLDSVVCGPDGTLYYHNDSGYVFAVKKNTAYLETLTTDIGNFKQPLESAVENYELVVPTGTENVTLGFTANDGSSITVNNVPVETSVEIALSNGTATANIAVTNSVDIHKYTVNIRWTSTNTGLKVSATNSNGAPGSGLAEITPEMNNNYSATLTNDVFARVWYAPSDSNAVAAASVVSGVAQSQNGAPVDSSFSLYHVAGSSGGPNRYNVYFADGCDDVVIKFTVTAEDGVTTEEHFVTVTRTRAQSLPEARVARLALISAVTARLTASDYTTASWSALQTAISEANTAVNNATSVAAVNAVAIPSADGLVRRTDGGSPGTGSGQGTTAYISVRDDNAEPEPVVYFSGRNIEIVDGTTTAYDLLEKTGLTLQTSGHPLYAGVYVEAIDGFGEFDDGELSGWMYKVNDVFPNKSSSLYVLGNGDRVEWVYTRDLGRDVGGGNATGNNNPDQQTDGNTPGTTITDGETPLGSFEDWENPFADVNENDWFYQAVAYVLSQELMNGTENDAFAPNSNLTRSMLITILARADGVDTTTGETWYSEAVAWAMSNGISDGSNLNDNITREQFVTMLYRYAAYMELDTAKRSELDQFTDAGEVSDWALEAMQWAVTEGLIQGRTETTIVPSGTATRAEGATLIMRFMENIIK